MEECDDWFNASCYHACYQIIVVCNALLIYWAVAEWEKSWPVPKSAKCSKTILRITERAYQEKEGEKYGTPRFANRAKSCL